MRCGVHRRFRHIASEEVMLAGCGIITSLSLMLIACPAVASEPQPPAAGRCQIERIDILEVRPHQSTFRFKPFYNLDHDTCHGKVKWKFVMKYCNSSEQGAVEQSCIGDKEDICKVDMEGSYKVALNKTIISDCFTLPGLLVVPRAALVLRDTYVKLDLKPDMRVQSWNLTAYEAFANRDELNPKCSSDRLTEIQSPLFEEPFIKGNSFSFSHEFSLDQCYCFKIRPNGYDTELTFPTGVIESPCRPVRTNLLPPTPTPQENHTWVIVCVVVIVAILLVPLMVCVIIIQLRKRRLMIPGLPQEGENLIKVPRDVLVIYARQEESHSKRVCELVRSLQSAGKSKIHDIHANTDDGKHADPNEWLRQRITKDRILILLSPALRKHLEVVFSLKRSLIAKEIGYTEDKIEMNPAIVHALRILVGQNDYSKIFVASFSSERFEEETGDFSEIITRERRYTLPEHLEELKVDMMLVREIEDSV